MTLRARVLLAMALVAVVVVAGAFATVSVVERRLTDQVDQRLQQFVPPGGPGGLLRRPTSIGEAADDRQLPDFSTAFVAARTGDGDTVVFARATESGTDLPSPRLDDIATPDPGGRGAVLSTVPARRGDLRYRVIARPMPDDGGTFVVATPLTVVDASVQEVRTIALVVAAIVLAVLALLAWWIIRLGVRPIKEMASVASTIGDDDLDRRVPEAPAGTEAGDLGRALNTMLGRLDESFQARAATDARLRQFVGDASHELRTPVQTILGYSELYGSGALDSGPPLDDAMRRVREESLRMSTLIEELLTLARLDQSRPLESEPVDLAVLVRDAVADARAQQPDRSITVSGPAEARVTGDEPLLRQVLANVVGNALVHTPVETAIEVSVRDDAAFVEVVVRDDGPGIDPRVAARVFERFVRADAARTRAHGGSGLGLAIVHDAIEAHGGSIALTSAPGEGTVVRVRLPAA